MKEDISGLDCFSDVEDVNGDITLVALVDVFMDIVVCCVLYKVVTVVKYGEEYLIEDISGLDCKIEVDVWRVVLIIDGEDIEDVIDEID